jgi:hypothetical protein
MTDDQKFIAVISQRHGLGSAPNCPLSHDRDGSVMEQRGRNRSQRLASPDAKKRLDYVETVATDYGLDRIVRTGSAVG